MWTIAIVRWQVSKREGVIKLTFARCSAARCHQVASPRCSRRNIQGIRRLRRQDGQGERSQRALQGLRSRDGQGATPTLQYYGPNAHVLITQAGPANAACFLGVELSLQMMNKVF